MLALALAAAVWSAPAPIAGSTGGTPQLVYTKSGQGIVAYSTNAAAPRKTPVLRANSSAAGTAFGPVRDVGRLNLSDLAMYGSDRLIAFGTTGAVHPRAAVAYGTPGGGFGTARPIGPDRQGYVIAGASNAAGDAAALLRICESSTRCSHSAPYLVLRRAGGEFGVARKLDHGPSIGGDVALNARGDVLVAWERPAKGSTGTRSIYDAVLTRSGRYTKHKLGEDTPSVRISALLEDDGTPHVAWVAQGVSEGDAGTPATLRLDGRKLETVPVTGTGRYVTAPGVLVAGDVVAWTGYQDGHFVVRAGLIGGSPQLLSDAAQDTVLAGLATGPGGGAVVLGRRGIRGNDPIGPVSLLASYRAAGAAAFDAPQAIKSGSKYIDVPALGFAGAAPVAVWSDFDVNSLLVSSLASGA